MAAALGAALLLPAIEALLLFAALGFGIALPFILIAYVPRLRQMLPMHTKSTRNGFGDGVRLSTGLIGRGKLIERRR